MNFWVARRVMIQFLVLSGACPFASANVDGVQFNVEWNIGTFYSHLKDFLAWKCQNVSRTDQRRFIDGEVVRIFAKMWWGDTSWLRLMRRRSNVRLRR